MIYLLMDTGAVSLLFYYKQYYNEHPTRLLVHFCQYLFRAWMHLEVELHITVYLYLQVPRFCQIAFQKGCDDLYSTSCTGRFCFLHILTDTWYCQIFSNCRLLMLWNGNIVLMESFALINIFFLIIRRSIYPCILTIDVFSMTYLSNSLSIFHYIIFLSLSDLIKCMSLLSVIYIFFDYMFANTLSLPVAHPIT